MSESISICPRCGGNRGKGILASCICGEAYIPKESKLKLTNLCPRPQCGNILEGIPGEKVVCKSCGRETRINPWFALKISKGSTPKVAKEGSAQTSIHYQIGDKQPIEIMQDYMTKEELIGFLKGNIIKYTLRLGRKDAPEKEAGKIEQYSKWLRKVINGEIINPREVD